MFYVRVENDDTAAARYWWRIYDDAGPMMLIMRAECSYPTRSAAIDAGWAAVNRLENRDTSVHRSRG